SDQGALVRDYTKWDNQPASVPAAYEALLRAAQIANTAPRGPTYVNLDAALQETKIGPLPPLPEVGRYRAPEAVLPKAELIEAAAQLRSIRPWARPLPAREGRIDRGCGAASFGGGAPGDPRRPRRAHRGRLEI